jgi:hypothetical protein
MPNRIWTTSGAVNQTRLTALAVLEKAARKCGVQPSVLGGEQLENALMSLNLILVALSNRGINLWAIDQRIRVPEVGQVELPLSDDTVNIINALYRRATYTTPTSFPTATRAEYDFGSGNTGTFTGAVYRVGGLDPAGLPSGTPSFDADTYTMTPELQYSDDDTNWVIVARSTLPNVKAGWYVGVSNTVMRPARYWRLKTLVNTLLPLSEAWFISSPNDVPMSPLSLDAYASYPNKYAQSSQPPQYFFDKQTPNPVMRLWPTVSVFGPQVVIWVQRQLQDANLTYDEVLDVPRRWLNAIIFRVAMQIQLELPKEVAIEGRYPVLEKQAEVATREAEDGEVDGTPVRIAVGIRGYTRG